MLQTLKDLFAVLQPPAPGDRDLVILAAARLGNTRLIDNIEVAA